MRYTCTKIRFPLCWNATSRQGSILLTQIIVLGISPFRQRPFAVLGTSPYASIQDRLLSLRKGCAANLHSLSQRICGSGPQERVPTAAVLDMWRKARASICSTAPTSCSTIRPSLMRISKEYPSSQACEMTDCTLPLTWHSADRNQYRYP